MNWRTETITITLTPELEAAIDQEARWDGKTPEAIVVEAIWDRLKQKVKPTIQLAPELIPRDDWERLVLGIGSNAGGSLTNHQLSREVMYEARDE